MTKKKSTKNDKSEKYVQGFTYNELAEMEKIINSIAEVLEEFIANTDPAIIVNALTRHLAFIISMAINGDTSKLDILIEQLCMKLNGMIRAMIALKKIE